ARDVHADGAYLSPGGPRSVRPGGQCAFSMKRSRLTTTRTTRPALTRPRLLVTENVNVSRRPSTRSTVASAFTVSPTGVGIRWSSWTRMPTVVIPGSRWSRIAATVASSTRPTSLGVPSIGTSPDRSDSAVSTGSTFSSIDAARPGTTGTSVRYDDDRRIPGPTRPRNRAADRWGLRRGVRRGQAQQLGPARRRPDRGPDVRARPRCGHQ